MRVLFFTPIATPLIPSPGGGMRAVDDRPYKGNAPYTFPRGEGAERKRGGRGMRAVTWR